MGNELTPLTEACPWNNPCWIADIFVYPPAAPVFLKCSIGGISKGDEWNEGNDPPPGGTYILEQTTIHTWQFKGGDVSILVRYLPGETKHWVGTNTPLPIHKYEGFGGECAKTTQNAHQSPIGQKWYGGSMSVEVQP